MPGRAGQPERPGPSWTAGQAAGSFPGNIRANSVQLQGNQYAETVRPLSFTGTGQEPPHPRRATNCRACADLHTERFWTAGNGQELRGRNYRYLPIKGKQGGPIPQNRPGMAIPPLYAQKNTRQNFGHFPEHGSSWGTGARTIPEPAQAIKTDLAGGPQAGFWRGARYFNRAGGETSQKGVQGAQTAGPFFSGTSRGNNCTHCTREHIKHSYCCAF